MVRWPVVACLAVACAVGLTGCGAPPPPPVPPTVVTLTLRTAADANATPDHQGAPLALRVYQLASAANFNAAEFFPLYNDDAGTLKSDLIRREDFLRPPGTSFTETITPMDPVKAIAVFAAYRDFQHVIWRGAADIPAHQTTSITVTAGHDGITVTAAPAAPPKAGS